MEKLEVDESGRFIKTKNNQGYATSKLDELSEEWVQFAADNSSSEHRALEIGAAYGNASVASARLGASVIANDIDENHLEYVTELARKEGISDEKLTVHCGDLLLSEGGSSSGPSSLSCILCCRVVHFFSSSQMRKAFIRLYDMLQDGGKLFIIAETPFLGNLKDSFLPFYEKRKAEGEEWPGECTNFAAMDQARQGASLPSLLHLLDKETLERELKRAGFHVEKLLYIDRKATFPPFLLLDGKESVGAVAIKRL